MDTTVFVRIRKSNKRLRLSLVETRRVDGKVRADHVASLGSIAVAMTVADRVQFWKALNGRLAGLSNRINPDDLRAIAGGKIPAPSKMEIDVANLQEYAAAWQGIVNFFKPREPKPPTPMHAALRRDSNRLKEQQLKDAVRRTEMAKERIKRVLRGEDARRGPPKVMDGERRDAPAIARLDASWLGRIRSGRRPDRPTRRTKVRPAQHVRSANPSAWRRME